MITLRDRASGALLGLAVGDAVGTTLEFKPRGTFQPITDMVGGGPFRLKPGQWTDDTSMALCLAESLIECRAFDAEDQMKRYISWYQHGHLSSTGKCFDIGNATRSALHRYMRDGNPMAGDTSPNSAGNGCLMRLAPAVISHTQDAEKAVSASIMQSRTTHRADECIQASAIFGEFLWRALNGYSKDQILAQPEHTPNMSHKLSAVVLGHSYARKSANAIKGSGYVVESLEAALWAFWTTDNYRDCILAAANLGDDADTTAAIAGQLAGAFYGRQGIPDEWIGKLHEGVTIHAMAINLLALQGATEEQ